MDKSIFKNLIFNAKSLLSK